MIILFLVCIITSAVLTVYLLIYQHKLKKKISEFQHILWVTPSAVHTVDTGQTITSWNRMAEEITGYKAIEVVGRKCAVFAHSLCKESCALYTQAALKPIISAECALIRKDGSVRVVSRNADVLKNKNGKIIGAIESFHDITERKNIEEKLKQAMAVKAEFTSMVSHELRAPLSSIKEGVSIIMDGLAGQVNQEQNDLLVMVKRNVDRLNRLVNDVLDLQKLESGVMPFEVRENDIFEVINEVYKTMVLVAKQKGLDLNMKFEGPRLPKIKFDRDKIIQVLINLVSNAVKFTEKGDIEIAARKEDSGVHITIKDTGPGIKKEDIPKLFHGFQQLDWAKQKDLGGTGLGLAISKEIITRHNGKIWVESDLGQGASFHFILPD